MYADYLNGQWLIQFNGPQYEGFKDEPQDPAVA
jgi:hypothetical protein